MGRGALGQWFPTHGLGPLVGSKQCDTGLRKLVESLSQGTANFNLHQYQDFYMILYTSTIYFFLSSHLCV